MKEAGAGESWSWARMHPPPSGQRPCEPRLIAQAGGGMWLACPRLLWVGPLAGSTPSMDHPARPHYFSARSGTPGVRQL